jgi:uncharacterized protein (DUF1330 family)
MSTLTVIVSGNVNNQDKIDQYKVVAGPVMKKHGATMPPQSYQVSEVIAGKAAPSFMLKIEFPNKENITAAFNDPDYIAVINERDEGFGDLSIFVVEQ